MKAFNTIFGGMLDRDTALDAFYAGDGAEAKAEVAEFSASLGLRGRDAEGLAMAHALEWAGILLVGLAKNGAGFDVALKAEVR